MQFSLEGLTGTIKQGITRWFRPVFDMAAPVSSNLFSLSFEPIREDGNYVIIRNFPTGWFLKILKRRYKTRKLSNMIQKYPFGTIKVHKFFLPELVYILSLGDDGGRERTAANTSVFLNDPWIDADKAQASDRIWRIGQDSPCFIYTLHLNTGSLRNLSDRNADILDWSKRMTDAIVKGE